MTEPGFQKANSSNLPRLDVMMVASFFSTNEKFVGAELKGVKNTRAGRESYGDDAIGYTQVNRTAPTCTVKARVTPEHKVRSKGYNVVLIVDEAENKVISVNCEDCAASSGGCKHAVALLMWVHRRSEEPAPTSLECYWKKAKLSAVGTSLKFILAEDLGVSSTAKCTGNNKSGEETTDSFLHEVLECGKKLKCDSQLLKHYGEIASHHYLSLNTLTFWFIENGGGDVKEFLKLCDFHMTSERCSCAEQETREQSNSSVWHDLRFGRVTASKIHEASRCQTTDGSLTEAILGARIPDNVSMKRGRDLEPFILKEVGKVVGKTFQRVGLLLNAKHPAIGASPDGICDEYVVEIKCPSTTQAVKNYIVNGMPSAKCRGQIQLQMHLAERQKGLFCVAHPDFETSHKVDMITVNYDRLFTEKLIEDAMKFWEDSIFPKLMRNNKQKK